VKPDADRAIVEKQGDGRRRDKNSRQQPRMFCVLLTDQSSSWRSVQYNCREEQNDDGIDVSYVLRKIKLMS
jgi:hypothetical protein